MRKKIIGILICMMLVITSSLMTLIIPEKTQAEAYPEGGEPSGETGLDLDYIWIQLGNFSNVTYKAYDPTDIPKGRSFESKGGDYTVKILQKEMNDNLSLENVTIEPLKYLDSDHHNYSSIINVSDFQITFHTQQGTTYPYPNPIPKKEMYVIPLRTITPNATQKKSKWSQDWSFGNLTNKTLIRPVDFEKLVDPIGETQHKHYILDDYELLNDETFFILLGSADYIAPDDPVPEEDNLTVFIIDDVAGAQDKINNISEAGGIIIIDKNDQGIEYININDLENLSYNVVSISNASGIYLLNLIDVYGAVYIDNLNLQRNIIVSYDFTCQFWPDEPFVLIDKIPDHNELRDANPSEYIKTKIFAFFRHPLQGYYKYPGVWDYLSCVTWKAHRYKVQNGIFGSHGNICKGIILYDANDVHFTVNPMPQWKNVKEIPGPGINRFTARMRNILSSYSFPIITVNNSIGDFLMNNYTTTTLTGWVNQTYLEETAGQPGASGSNIYGNITREKSPNDAIAILSNRYDGMWGQTPGDSGVGMAIVLGVAKYFKDHPSIKPKYNLTFLFTTAEEFGFHGARFHVDNHSTQNIVNWIILDQNGFDQSDTGLTLSFSSKSQEKIYKAILNDSQYTGYDSWVSNSAAAGSEQGTANKKVNNTACLCKGDKRILSHGKEFIVGYAWDNWHRAGANYTKGDSMDNIDRDDVNATARLTLNLVKYFMINPDCSFNGSVTYTPVDSPNDTDALNDSINATFSVKTTLPCDRVRVKAKLKTWPSNITVLWKNFDFDATSAGVTKTITVTLPPSTTNLPAGNYRLMLELYNSTGRIDEIVYLIGGGRENDSDLQSNYAYLHPRGNIVPNKPVDITGPYTLQFLQTGTFNTSTTDSNNDHVQYQWRWAAFDFDKIGPYASGDTCSIKHKFHGPGLKTIYVRARDDYYGYLFDGPLSLILKRYGDWGEWSDPFNVNVKLLTDFNMACTKIASSQNAQSSIKLPSVLQINSLYNALIFGGTEPNTYQWNFSGDTSQEKNVEYNFSGTGTKIVTLNVTDNDGYSNEISVNVTVANLSASYNISLPSSYTLPGENTTFNDTSAVIDNRCIENWTWDFDDGTICYDRNATHLYDFPGVYNVTLTVTDNESGIDVCYQLITVDYDVYLPEIIYVGGSPDTVGFGMNVSIAVDATDYSSGVDSVSINVTNPDNASANYTMTHVINDTYFFIFNDTWQPGVYNYSIWVVDQANNTNCTSGFNFTVSAEATINIVTLQDSYSEDEYINITDPPNPPVNLTLVGRGLTWNTYYNATSGYNILEAYQSPVNYQEDNGTWTPINSSLQSLATNHPAYTYGYRKGNDRGLFGVYFKPNAQNDWPIAFTYNRSDNPTAHVIRSKLVGVGYVDPASNWTYQYLQTVQSSQGQTTGNSITYNDVFTGTDVTWRYGNTGFKEEITLSNATKTMLQNHPPSQYGLHNASSYLVCITKLDYQNLNLYNGSGVLSGNVTISNGGVAFKDALGRFTCALPLGEAYELNNESVREKLTYRIVHLNGNTYLLSGLKVSDLAMMTFPVVIDPTLTVYTNKSDGYLYNFGENYSTVWSAEEGTVSDTENFIAIGQTMANEVPENYSIYRGFLFFDTSSLPSNVIIDNATLALCKKDDYSTTDFVITIQNGQPTYPHDPLETRDYEKDHYDGNGGGLNTTDFEDGVNEIALTNLDWINKGNMTKLCLRSSHDINGTEPTGNEYVTIYSADITMESQSHVPHLIIAYRNQSKIKNTGSTDIKGYLLIQVQFYESGEWVVDQDTINETAPRTINAGQQLALDTIFNGLVNTNDLTHGDGTYRVYAAFRDPEENILKTDNEIEMVSWYQFEVTTK